MGEAVGLHLTADLDSKAVAAGRTCRRRRPTRRRPAAVSPTALTALSAHPGRIHQPASRAPSHPTRGGAAEGRRRAVRPAKLAATAIGVEADLHGRGEELDGTHRECCRQPTPVEPHAARPEGSRRHLALVEFDRLPHIRPAAVGAVGADRLGHSHCTGASVGVKPAQPRVTPQVTVAMLHRHFVPDRNGHAHALRPPAAAAATAAATASGGCAGGDGVGGQLGDGEDAGVLTRGRVFGNVHTKPQRLHPAFGHRHAAHRLRRAVWRVDAADAPFGEGARHRATGGGLKGGPRGENARGA